MEVKMKAKALNLLLCLSILFAGCAGREPNPISTYMPGDENLSCNAYFDEMANCEKEMAILKPKTSKAGTNSLWAFAGFFLIFPFFFMDFKDAEKVEYNAYQRRLNRLKVLATERNCFASDPAERDKKVIGYRVDTSRRDAAGNFVRVPVIEGEQK